MREREWNIEPGDVVSYDIMQSEGVIDPLQFGVVMDISLGDDNDVQGISVRSLPLVKGDLLRQINVSQVDGIWHPAN